MKEITEDDIPEEEKNKIQGTEVSVEQQASEITKSLEEKTRYEVKDDDSFTIDFGVVDYDGRIRVCSEENIEAVGAEPHWVKFKMWDYSLQSFIRLQATKYDNQKRFHTLDKDLQDRLKLQRLMLDWSFKNKSDRFRIHRVNGVMTDESYNVMMGMHVNVLNHIINAMNEILENNG